MVAIRGFPKAIISVLLIRMKLFMELEEYSQESKAYEKDRSHLGFRFNALLSRHPCRVPQTEAPTTLPATKAAMGKVPPPRN